MFLHGDSAHLPDRVVRLLSLDENVRRRMCADLRRAVVEQHGLDRLWDRLVDVLQSEINRARRASRSRAASVDTAWPVD